ncbi:hypothetical protein V3565_04845 [Bartonella sp. B10]
MNIKEIISKYHSWILPFSFYTFFSFSMLADELIIKLGVGVTEGEETTI